MKVITLQTCSLIVDAIYRDTQRIKFERKTIKQVAADCGTSSMTVLRVKQILISLQIIIVEGNTTKQTTTWHPNKSKPNPAMLTNIYRELTKDAKSRVRVNQKRPASVSLESALWALVRLGYTGVISKSKVNGHTTITESIDLSKIEKGE